MKNIYFLSLIFITTLSHAQTDIAFDFLKNYNNVRDIAIAQNQKEVYFTIQSPNEQVSKIAFSKKTNNNWTKPELVSFSGAFRDLEPFLSPDGLRLYFASNRPLHETETLSKDYDIWYVTRKNTSSEWSTPINMGSPINTEKDQFYPSVAANGNLYFTTETENSLGKEDIYVSQIVNGKYTTPKNLGGNVNSEGYEFNAFISPDEKFLIFTGYNRKGGIGSGDLYISYNENGSWSSAKNLAAGINSQQMDYCPFYDFATNTLYFTSKRSNIKDAKFTSINDFITEISKTENGFSRIYKVNLKL